MKRKLISAILALFIVLPVINAAAASGGSNPYSDGSIVGQFGIGYGVMGMYGDTVIPPVSLSVEYSKRFAPKVPLSIGGIIGYAKSEYTYNYGAGEWGYQYSYLMIGVRVAYHFCDLLQLEKTDLYAGVLTGYNIVSAKEVGTNYLGTQASDSYMLYGFFGGARYFLTDNFAVFGEVGYGIGFVTVGLSYKF